MSSERMKDLRALADDLYDRDAGSEEIAKVAADLGAERGVFVERLALRGFLDADEDMPVAAHETIATGMLETFRTAYAKAGPDEVEPVNGRIEPKAWLDLAAALGGDNGFVAKLARRTVTPPTKWAFRDLADMLGVSLSRMRAHFAADSSGLGLAGVEMKSSAKPVAHAGETFDLAVRSSSLPPALKERWLKD